MRKIIAGPALLAAALFLNGCTSFSSSEPAAVELTSAPPNVKIYDVMPPYSTTLEQISVTACDGTPESATARLMSQASRRGGNGILQLSCTSSGMSFSCWKSATCTATAINVGEPPPPPPPPPRRGKPKPKPPVRR
jgi:hypothetical protein